MPATRPYALGFPGCSNARDNIPSSRHVGAVRRAEHAALTLPQCAGYFRRPRRAARRPVALSARADRIEVGGRFARGRNDNSRVSGAAGRYVQPLFLRENLDAAVRCCGRPLYRAYAQAADGSSRPLCCGARPLGWRGRSGERRSRACGCGATPFVARGCRYRPRAKLHSGFPR